MTFYEIDKEDEELIKIALSKLESNFDDKKYNHTVGAAMQVRKERMRHERRRCPGLPVKI